MNMETPSCLATIGTKRKLQAEHPEGSKRRVTGSPHRDSSDVGGGSSGDVDTDQEQGTIDSAEGDGHSDLNDGSLEDYNPLSEQDDSGQDDDVEDTEDGEDYDEFGEFKWLKSINIRLNADDAEDPPQVGFCVAKLIDRDRIRATFHRDMEEPTHDTATIGFDVFDRWGCLKSEFMTHPVKRGTGVWGPELNQGKFLLIETLLIQEGNQRKGARSFLNKSGREPRISLSKKTKSVGKFAKKGPKI